MAKGPGVAQARGALAIPVDNAPKPYEPPPRRPEQPLPGVVIHTGTLDDLRGGVPGRRVQVQARMGRGCSLALLLGVIGFCVVSSFFVWMLAQFAGREYDTRALRITAAVREAARDQGRESLFDADLTHFDDLVTRHEVSLIATAALVRRNEIAKRDGTLDEADVDRLMEVVHDAAIHEGVVDPARYPEASEMPQ